MNSATEKERKNLKNENQNRNSTEVGIAKSINYDDVISCNVDYMPDNGDNGHRPHTNLRGSKETESDNNESVR